MSTLSEGSHSLPTTESQKRKRNRNKARQRQSWPRQKNGEKQDKSRRRQKTAEGEKRKAALPDIRRTDINTSPVYTESKDVKETFEEVDLTKYVDNHHIEEKVDTFDGLGLDFWQEAEVQKPKPDYRQRWKDLDKAYQQRADDRVSERNYEDSDGLEMSKEKDDDEEINDEETNIEGEKSNEWGDKMWDEVKKDWKVNSKPRSKSLKVRRRKKERQPLKKDEDIEEDLAYSESSEQGLKYPKAFADYEAALNAIEVVTKGQSRDITREDTRHYASDFTPSTQESQSAESILRIGHRGYQPSESDSGVKGEGTNLYDPLQTNNLSNHMLSNHVQTKPSYDSQMIINMGGTSRRKTGKPGRKRNGLKTLQELTFRKGALTNYEGK